MCNYCPNVYTYIDFTIVYGTSPCQQIVYAFVNVCVQTYVCTVHVRTHRYIYVGIHMLHVLYICSLVKVEWNLLLISTKYVYCFSPSGELLEYKHQNEQMSVELSRTRDELEVLKKHLQVACMLHA